MRTTTKPLTVGEEDCLHNATDRIRAALKRIVQAAGKGERGVVVVEARYIRQLAEMIEKGL